jgi:hypothetical protein
MRVVLLRTLALLASLPALGSALVVLTVPPVSRLLPGELVAALRPASSWTFDLVGRIPPESLAGRAFYGSYEMLVPLFGVGALAAHSALLGLPWLALGLALAFARPSRRGPSPA